MTAHLLAVYLELRGIAVYPGGAWTLRAKSKKAGLEPDKCYIFGPNPKARKRPDLAIEVIWTSGGMKKLEIYRRLGVGEVWFWKANKIAVHVLGPDGYKPHPRSVCLPDLDLALLCQHALMENQTEAMTAYRQALQNS